MDLFIFVLNIIGTIAFAASGAILAIEKRMDVFGVIVLGIVTAVGGGYIRDITLGHFPPEMFKTPIFTIIAISVAIILFIPGIRKIFLKNQTVYDAVIFIMDSIGLGAFTVLGVTYSMRAGFDGLFLNLFVGTITGVGGGVLRDIFACEMPCIFRKHIYACASTAGALITYLLYYVAHAWWVAVAGVISIFIIRCFSAYFRWNLPLASDKNEPITKKGD